MRPFTEPERNRSLDSGNGGNGGNRCAPRKVWVVEEGGGAIEAVEAKEIEDGKRREEKKLEDEDEDEDEDEEDEDVKKKKQAVVEGNWLTNYLLLQGYKGQPWSGLDWGGRCGRIGQERWRSAGRAGLGWAGHGTVRYGMKRSGMCRSICIIYGLHYSAKKNSAKSTCTVRVPGGPGGS